jgi:hypothetical protein
VLAFGSGAVDVPVAASADAFAAQADGYVMVGAAIRLGVAIPSLVYALTGVGAGLRMDCRARA